MEDLKQTGSTTSTPTTSLTALRIESVVMERSAMLDSVKQDIGSDLYAILAKKIAYEHAFLIERMESDSKRTEAKKMLNKVLKAEYFTQKSLDAHIL